MEESKRRNVIIPDSGEETEESETDEATSLSGSTSSMSVNLHSLGYQHTEHNPHSDNYIPQDVLDDAREAESHLIPSKSKLLYDKAYKNFKSYLEEKKIRVINETVLMGYFYKLSMVRVPSTCWGIHSMLKKTLLAYDSIDIRSFIKVTEFLSANEKKSEHEKKKAYTLDEKQIATFLHDAPDSSWLAVKVALILGIHGVCRNSELYNLKVEQVVDHGTCLDFKLEKTKNNKNRGFTLNGEYCDIVRKYITLRPRDMDKRNFFIKYAEGKCQRQVIGIHYLAKYPKAIASYLGLPNPEKYTGHSYRRSGATLAANSGIDFISLKKLGGWNSAAVAESYIDNFLAQKKKVSGQMSKFIKESVPRPSTVSKETPLLVSTSSTIVRPLASTSDEVPPAAPKKIRLDSEVHSPTTSASVEEVLKENQRNAIIGFPLDQNQNIQLHFHNCSGFNVFGYHDKENSN